MRSSRRLTDIEREQRRERDRLASRIEDAVLEAPAGQSTDNAPEVL